MIAQTLSNLGCNNFAVSNIDEAVGLRNAGIKGNILILGYTSPKYVKTLSYLDLSQAIISEDYAQALSETGVKVRCHVAIDTGMNRVGLNSSDVQNCSRVIRRYSQTLTIEGIFTHLCVADSDRIDDVQFTQEQIARFKLIMDSVKDLKLPYIHCYNSAGVNSFYSKEEDQRYNKIVRLGIVLFGLKPDYSNTLPNDVAPALTWKSVISMVKRVKAGESLGYGRTITLKRDSVIATVTTGYADGLNRLLSNRGFMMVNGFKAPIVGRICMDQTLLDVTDINDVKDGDVVTILGSSGSLTYNADDMAQELDTIGYEILCDISKRVQRFYYNR